MSLEDDVGVLSKVSFFEGINADQLRLLAFGAESVSLLAGQDLFLQDAPSDSGFVVVSGLIDLTISTERGVQILTSIEGGGLVGELALVTNNLRSTNAVARRDSRLIKIPRVLFTRMLDKYPESAYDLHQKISRSVRSTILQLEKVKFRLSS